MKEEHDTLQQTVTYISGPRREEEWSKRFVLKCNQWDSKKLMKTTKQQSREHCKHKENTH